jgi:hypothetical protein
VSEFRKLGLLCGGCLLGWNLEFPGDESESKESEWTLAQEGPAYCQVLARYVLGRRFYHLHPILSVNYPPIGPPRLRPVVAAMLT